MLSGMREVSMSEFVKAHAAGATVIEWGEVEEYNRGHIPGAVSLPSGIVAILAAPAAGHAGTRPCMWCALPVTAA